MAQKIMLCHSQLEAFSMAQKLCCVIHSWRLLVWHKKIMLCHSQLEAFSMAQKLCCVIHSWRLLVWHKKIMLCHSQLEAFSMAQRNSPIRVTQNSRVLVRYSKTHQSISLTI